MSVETFSPIPLSVFGTWTTLLDPSDVPPGMSPDLADIEFFPGGVRTRSGLVSQFALLAGAPKVNGLKSYITTNLIQRLLVFDSLGTLYKEISPGTLTLVASGAAPPNSYLASTTLFGREYMAFSDGLVGQDLPRQYDDTYFDRVSQVGPGEGPAVVDAPDAGNISPGAHQCVVVFVTRQGYWTAPSPATTWTAAGSQKVNVTNIPTGPSNVVQRLLAFTAAGGATFYHVPATMVINDNVATSLEVDFTDSTLLSGISMEYLIALIELPNQLGVIDYVQRLFWWGERAKMSNWRNPTFDGGWDASGNGRPLGWTRDPTNGAGGSRESSDVISGDAYRITGDGATVTRGLISQNAVTDAAGNSLLVKNTDYSVRAPESYDGVSGFMLVAANNGQAIRCAFKLRNLLYFVKERSLYVTSDDGVDEPALWTLEEVSNKIGTPSVHGVGFGEEWVVIAGRAGLYYFDGSQPQKLSQEIQPTWDSVNWQYGHRIWVQVDVEKQRIYIGVPIGSALEPNQVLVLDYTEGFSDPVWMMLYAPGRSRKWAPWKISANSCGIIERSTGVAQIFFGNNAANGKVYALTKGQHSDDGAAIHGYYTTAFLSRSGQTGRNLFGYLTAYVQGTGTLAISAFSPGDATVTSIGSWTLASPAAQDMELYTNTLAERVGYQFGTNAAGSWFSLTKFVPWAKPDPWAFVRGHN